MEIKNNIDIINRGRELKKKKKLSRKNTLSKYQLENSKIRSVFKKNIFSKLIIKNDLRNNPNIYIYI